MKLHRSFAALYNSGKVQRLIAHSMFTRERQNASQKDIQSTTEFATTTQNCCPFIAVENAVKVRTYALMDTCIIGTFVYAII